MNFSSMASLALRDVCTSKDWGRRKKKRKKTFLFPSESGPDYTLKVRLYLSEGEDTFLSPNHTAFHHDKIIVHFTVVWEASLQESFQDKMHVKKKQN